MTNKTKIIAEAGLNHNGSLGKAKKLVKIAKNAGVDYIKFQLFSSDHYINKEYPHKLNYRKVFKRFKAREFSFQEWKKIISFANKNKIKVFFSVFDIPSVKLNSLLKIKLIKIPSGEINNYPLLREINKKKFNVIMSTGMSTVDEISVAIKILKNCNIELLHCVSEYPLKKPNLKSIIFLKKKFNLKVGYSDHTSDILTPALSVMMGAHMVEKHFTYFKNQKLGDHKFSLSAKELKEMVKFIRIAEVSSGIEEKKVTKKEKKLKFFARKGIYLNTDKLKGQKIKKEDLSVLRPEGQTSVDEIDKIINKVLKKNLKKNQSIKKKFLKTT